MTTRGIYVGLQNVLNLVEKLDKEGNLKKDILKKELEKLDFEIITSPATKNSKGEKYEQ